MNSTENTIFELDELDYQSPLGNWLQVKTEEVKLKTIKRKVYKPLIRSQDKAYKVKSVPSLTS